MRHPQHPKKHPFTRPVAGLAATAAMIATMAAHGAGVPAAQEVAWLSRLARHGDAGAELQLGLAYREGRYGLARDPRAARYWLDASARDGLAYAAAIEQSGDAALPDAGAQQRSHPFAALVERLDLPGLNTLSAVWHTVAAGSPSSYSRDALLARARQHDPLAEYQLGLRYRDGGWAVQPDAQQAQAWLRRAATDGNRLAARALAETRHD